MEKENNEMKTVEKLHDSFCKVLSINESLMQTSRHVNENVLGLRYRRTLKEEQKYLLEVVDYLKNHSLDSQALTKKLFIIYHADEVGNLHLGGWKRETQWIEQEGESALEDITNRAGEKKESLEEAASHLEKILGEKFKYVIPALYRD